MVITPEKFFGLSFEEQRKRIHNYKLQLEERIKDSSQLQLSYGKAAADFYKNVLKLEKIDNFPILSHLEDKLYLHCIECGYLFDGKFDNDKTVGYLSEILDEIFSPFNISSGYCNECFNEAKIRMRINNLMSFLKTNQNLILQIQSRFSEIY